MSEAHLDANKIAAEVFAKIIKESATGLADFLKSPIKSLIDNFRFSMEAYLDKTFNKCNSIKTFLNRDEPVNLLTVYVETRFKCGKRLFSDQDFIEKIRELKYIVVLGSAGCGKSMFMKFLFIGLCQQPRRQVPLFIELRHLAEFTSKNLLAFVYHTVTAPGAVSTYEQFEKGLANGLFTVILDGFDEIDHDDRKDIEKQILEIRDKYPNTIIIVSSREDDRFSSWTNFSLFHVLPLEQDQLLQLINKSHYDKETKKKFIKAVREQLYEKHKSFLSNPLLAIMMLITFKEIAHIPEKVHIFYEQAFDALFFKHDASKEAAFRRRMHTSLPIDEFKLCLSCFSIATYIREKFSFLESKIKDELHDAINMSKVKTNPDDLLSDLLESVCILQRDGLHVVFTHRSFQEYFAALFISRGPMSVGRLLDNLCRRHNDIVLNMVFDMNRNLIEREWVLPRLRVLMDRINEVDENDVRSLMKLFWGSLTLSWFPDTYSWVGQMSVSDRALQSAWISFLRLYPSTVQKAGGLGKRNQDDQTVFEKLIDIKKIKLPKNKTLIKDLISIDDVEEEWLKQMLIWNETVMLRGTLIQLYKQIEQNVATQESVIGSLLHPFSGNEPISPR